MFRYHPQSASSAALRMLIADKMCRPSVVHLPDSSHTSPIGTNSPRERVAAKWPEGSSLTPTSSKPSQVRESGNQTLYTDSLAVNSSRSH